MNPEPAHNMTHPVGRRTAPDATWLRHDRAVPILHSDIRTMLEAAAPLLGPRPAENGRSECPACGRDVLTNGDGSLRRHNRWQDEPCNGLAGQDHSPRPLLDRDAVKRILGDVRALPVTSSGNAHVDAVMELARPMPTREQILLRLQTARGHRWSDEQTAEAVLELLTGGET